jgi:hypothetical protein
MAVVVAVAVVAVCLLLFPSRISKTREGKARVACFLQALKFRMVQNSELKDASRISTSRAGNRLLYRLR